MIIYTDIVYFVMLFPLCRSYCRTNKFRYHSTIIEYLFDDTMFKCEENRFPFENNDYLKQDLSQKHNMKYGDHDKLLFNSY